MTPFSSIQPTLAPLTPTQGMGINIGGILPIRSAKDLQIEDRRQAEAAQQQPAVKGLAGYVRNCWTTARLAKEQTVEPRMFKSVRARRGEYDPDRMTVIRQSGGSEIYMMVTSVKCRGAASWLRDILLGKGEEKPWTLLPTPLPALPPESVQEIRQQATQQVAAAMQMGQQVSGTDLRRMLIELREMAFQNLFDEAKYRVSNMERKIEDQLTEGGFFNALDQFIDDITTFPAAFIKGPIVRNKPKMKWGADGELTVEDTLVLEWERVDPFMCYSSPSSAYINDGYFIERHKMRQTALEELIGVEGYDDASIRAVLDQYGRGGLQEWLIVDSTKAMAEGRSTTAVMQNQEHTIDALQFWGSVSGQMLLDWGMSETDTPDKHKQYPCEVWLIGSWVIKASLNYHPLGQKPYFKASYEDIPGTFWGNSVADLVRDCQDMCNSAARALANNMGISSGPQVSVNSDRMPPGEDITNMYPWKIWQFSNDPMGSNSTPIDFFQPNSNTAELVAVFEKFATLADEYSGVPRYMTGDSPAGGAGRTASGMSMLMTNASKSMKQVISNIDNNIITPLLERLYFYNMKYSDDPELKGDISIIAQGASGVLTKEATQLRRNEFLIATANPFDIQILGLDGRAALLREQVKTLDMDTNDIVPPPERMKLMQRAQAAMAQQNPAAPQQSPQPANGQVLQNGAPVTDNFAPTPNP